MCTLLAIGGFVTIPSRETGHHRLHQHIGNHQTGTHAWCFVQNVRQLIAVGLKMNPHERHMAGRRLQGRLKEEREPQACSVFKGLAHVQTAWGTATRCLPTRSYLIWKWADMVPQLKISAFPCHALWHFDRGLSYAGGANPSQTWVSGTCCLSSRNLRKSVFTWLKEKNPQRLPSQI